MSKKEKKPMDPFTFVVCAIFSTFLGMFSTFVFGETVIEHLQKFPRPEVGGVAYPKDATGGAVWRGYIDTYGQLYVCQPNHLHRGGVKTYGFCDGVKSRYIMFYDAVPHNKKLTRFRLSGPNSGGFVDIHAYWK